MKNQSDIRLRALITGLVFLVLTMDSFPLIAQESPFLHGPRTRGDFELNKSLPGDPFADKEGELGDAAAGSDRYDVLRYDLDLEIDPVQRHIAGSVKMVFSSLEEDLTDFVFDLRYNLVVESVTHLSVPLVFTHDADSVSVVLQTPVAPGAVDSVVVAYRGFPRENMVINRGLMFKTHRRFPDGPPEDNVPIIANMSQPGYAQSWWPCKDKPGDKFMVSMKLTVPDSLIGVSNGIFVSEEEARPGWASYAWRENYPIATYLVSVAISDYILLQEDCTTTGLGSVVPLKNWVFLADVEDALIEFEPLCEMMDFCETRYGPYPFLGEKYGHAEFIWPGAMEHQTVTSIGLAALDGQGTHDWLVVHELAHQWFGDSLTPKKWADIWLNEGFATYAEALWFEYAEGREAYFELLDDYRNEEEWQSQGPVYDPVPVFPGRVIYDKGAWILHSLRGRMGDPVFFDFLAEWGGSPARRDSNVVTEDFLNLANQWSGETLDDFLWPYLKETIIPQVEFLYDIGDGIRGTGTKLTVTLRQRQGPLFDNVFPLEVTTTDGVVSRRIPLTTPSTSVTFELAYPITKVELDPERWVIWDEYEAGPPPPGLTNIYPNPSEGGYVVFGYQLIQSSRVQVRVMDTAGRQIYHHDLGTVAPLAAGNEYAWDVRAVSGSRVASGIYWVTIEIDGQRNVGKFSVIR